MKPRNLKLKLVSLVGAFLLTASPALAEFESFWCENASNYIQCYGVMGEAPPSDAWLFIDGTLYDINYYVTAPYDGTEGLLGTATEECGDLGIHTVSMRSASDGTEDLEGASGTLDCDTNVWTAYTPPGEETESSTSTYQAIDRYREFQELQTAYLILALCGIIFVGIAFYPLKRK